MCVGPNESFYRSRCHEDCDTSHGHIKPVAEANAMIDDLLTFIQDNPLPAALNWSGCPAAHRAFGFVSRLARPTQQTERNNHQQPLWFKRQ